MSNFYLMIDEEGKVYGSQASPGRIDREDYILTSASDYNRYVQKDRYEEMVYDKTQRKFEVLPDPRSELRVTVPNSSRMGSLIDIDVDTDLLDVDHVILEYQGPDGRIGLIRANIQQNGRARVNIRPDKSGYYRFGESDSYKLVEEQIIAVYEE